MATPIEFWFDFSSPYAYFAAMEVDARLARFERAVQWRPFLLGVAFKKTGMGSSIGRLNALFSYFRPEKPVLH